MSLLLDSFESCMMLNKQTASDGYGGYITSWSNGAEFDAAIVPKTFLETKVADKQDGKALYTVTTIKAMNLQYHDVFVRVSDGKIFRVTSDGDDNHTPKSATLDMRNVDAEEWQLPSNG